MESIVENIINKIDIVSTMYYRLVLIIASSGGGKTKALQEIGSRINAPLININLELSRRLLPLTNKQRVLQLKNHLASIVNESESKVVLFDNIEMLFNITLKQDPLRLLQALSRNKTMVVSWNGAAKDGYIFYGKPEHPEFKKYPSKDIIIISREEKR